MIDISIYNDMSDNPANNYYPQDLYQTEKKKSGYSPTQSFDALLSMFSLNNPLLSTLLKGQTLDQKSLIQAFSSLTQNQSQHSEVNALDDDFYEEL